MGIKMMIEIYAAAGGSDAGSSAGDDGVVFALWLMLVVSVLPVPLNPEAVLMLGWRLGMVLTALCTRAYMLTCMLAYVPCIHMYKPSM